MRTTSASQLSATQKSKLIGTVTLLLTQSKEGMTAKEIGASIKIEKGSIVREIARNALSKAAKGGATSTAIRKPKSPVKVYNIVLPEKNSDATVQPSQKRKVVK